MKKPKRVHMSVRLPDAQQQTVDEIADRTGWTASKTICWLIQVAAHEIKTPTSEARRVLEAQTRLRTVEANAASAIAAARKKTRAAIAVIAGKDLSPGPAKK